VVVELNRTGEVKVEEGTLEESLRRDLDADLPLFIPAKTYMKGNKPVTVQLMQGYAFVGAGLDEVSYFALEKRPYVSRVLSSKNASKMRVLQVVSDEKVKELRRKLREAIASDIEIGAHVTITEGQYAKLDGKVVGLEEDNAFVYVVLRSLKIVASVPVVFLETVECGADCAVCLGLGDGERSRNTWGDAAWHNFGPDIKS